MDNTLTKKIYLTIVEAEKLKRFYVNKKHYSTTFSSLFNSCIFVEHSSKTF